MPHDSLDAVVNVRVSQAQKRALREAAEIAGLSLSSYCRRRCLGHAVVAHADRAIIRELRRIGGLLKFIHTQSDGAYSAQTAGALRELREAVRRLAE